MFIDVAIIVIFVAFFCLLVGFVIAGLIASKKRNDEQKAIRKSPGGSIPLASKLGVKNE